VLFALGGSTNGVLHLLALAREADVPLDVRDFNHMGARVPLLGNLTPGGLYNMVDLGPVGGIPAVMAELARHGLIDEGARTVSGATVGENLAAAGLPDYGLNPPGAVPGTAGHQDVLFPVSAPVAPPGRHISVLSGSLAPGSAVIKLSGKDILSFRGPARVFDSESAAHAAINTAPGLPGRIVSGDVVVIRYEGPRGAPVRPLTARCSLLACRDWYFLVLVLAHSTHLLAG
jgi:dihydroxy-acid dehydratase